MAIVTFTTDFGQNDHYVGTMKGVLLGINPAAQVVDICNAVRSYDVLEGALIIAQAYRYFPANTVHLVVVDPGVGTTRRPIVVDTGRHTFVAPDNGVLSFVYEREDRVTVRHITSDHYFLQPVSATFQGRDVFAPIAGYLSKGIEPSRIGSNITDYVRFSIPRPKTEDGKTIKALVLKTDKFGNLVTNIRPEDAPALFRTPPPAFRITVGKGEVRMMRYAFAEGASGELFGILGSMGFLEIATNRGSAAQLLSAAKGSEVILSFE